MMLIGGKLLLLLLPLPLVLWALCWRGLLLGSDRVARAGALLCAAEWMLQLLGVKACGTGAGNWGSVLF